jgi:tetratricopeptide (TPR) repeat protein
MRPILCSILLVGTALGTIQPGHAQVAPFAVDRMAVSAIGDVTPQGDALPEAEPARERVAQASGQPDETALRYFAQQGDTERMRREAERLRALYPNWQPPADPLASDFVPDQSMIEIWNLVTAGDYAGARAAIDAKKARDTAFVPTADLIQTIERGEAGGQLRTASEAGDYQGVIAAAAGASQLLTCASVDNLWRLGEAFAKVGNVTRAIDTHTYILTNCTDPTERFATMQKAMDLFGRDEIEPLLAIEKKDTAGRGEFASIRLDLARRAVAAALEEGGKAPSAEDVDLLATEAKASRNAEDLRLLGYFELDKSRPDEARRHFQSAMDAEPSAESAEGLGVALLQLNDPAAAEEALAEYRDSNETIEGVYRDAAAAMLAIEPRLSLNQTVLGRIVRATTSSRDANLAQEMGWYAYGFNQPQTALEWFQTALTWQSDLEPAAYGMMIAANALGDTVRVEDIRRAWGGRSVRIAQFGAVSTGPTTSVPLPQERPQHVAQTSAAVRSTPAPRAAAPSNAPTPRVGGGGGGGGGGSCQAYRPPASLSPGAALNHAWCLMELNRPGQAVEHFGRALDAASQATRSDAAYGRALAYVRLGLPDEAAVAATAAPLSGKRAIELDIAILTQKATSAYGVGRYQMVLAMLDERAQYAPERNDLLTLRAWSYFHLKRYREAERIFEAVAATGYGDALAGLEAARAMLVNY